MAYRSGTTTKGQQAGECGTKGNEGNEENMQYRSQICMPQPLIISSLFPSLSTVRILSCAGSLLTLVLAGGCWSSQTSVEGDVTYDGQPVGVGRILFLPENPKLIKRGGRFENGHYKLATPEGPPAGTHKVEIHWLKPTGKKYRNEFGEELDVLDEGLPDKYNTKSTLTATVKPGRNVVDFKLEK
jgi:hypothetical protein